MLSQCQHGIPTNSVPHRPSPLRRWWLGRWQDIDDERVPLKHHQSQHNRGRSSAVYGATMLRAVLLPSRRRREADFLIDFAVMQRRHVNIPPRSFVHGANNGAKKSGVPALGPEFLVGLRNDISVAASLFSPRKPYIARHKIGRVVSDTTHHISCSVVRHISTNGVIPVLANMPSAFRCITAFPRSRVSVWPMVSRRGCGGGNDEADLQST